MFVTGKQYSSDHEEPSISVNEVLDKTDLKKLALPILQKQNEEIWILVMEKNKIHGKPSIEIVFHYITSNIVRKVLVFNLKLSFRKWKVQG